MKRFTGLLSRSKSISTRGTSNRNSAASTFDTVPIDSPEANAIRAIRSFCDSGSHSNGGEEVLHLPTIVESAESSPSAAAAAALQIKKFLGKEYSPKPYVQYNAIMLIKILCDNPGATFTRNFDKGFVSVVRDMLRNCRDGGSQQILRETLDSLEMEKGADEGLALLLQMWRREKGAGASFRQSRAFDQSVNASSLSQTSQQQQGGREGGSRKTLPNAGELASRVEEAKNTAKILLQFVQTTPSEEVLGNELLREFSERCQSAQRSMQGYINCDNPAPDHDTMQTLIETNEQLSLAMSRHQRAVLAARRALGTDPSPNNATTPENGHSMFAAPSTGPAQAVYPQPSTYTNGNSDTSHFQGYTAPSGPPPSQRNTSPPQQNPFTDPAPLAIEPTHYGSSYSNHQQEQEQQQQQPPPQLPPHKPQTVNFQTFNIEPEGPPFSPPLHIPKRQNTLDLENAYSASTDQISPLLPRPTAAPSSSEKAFPSPASASASASPQQRPAIGAWHNSEVTPSYVDRQESAADGITMHGAQSDEQVQEIDGFSQVGRRDRDRDRDRSRF